MERSQFIPLLAALCVGIVAGTLMSSGPDAPPKPPSPPVVRQEPTNEATSNDNDDVRYLRERIAEMEVYITGLRNDHEKEVTGLREALDTAKEMLKRRSEKDRKRDRRNSVAHVVAEAPEFYAEKTARDDRFIPYMPYRSYRNYRAFRAYKTGEDQRRSGSKLDCNEHPHAEECVGTFAACELDTDVPGCVGTDLYCREFPQNKHCVGTKAYCLINTGDSLCAGTQVWCQANPRSNLCKGTQSDCESDPNRVGCYGTAAYCANDAGQVCRSAKESL